MSVGDWLRNLGLQQYESVFIENAIDTDVLIELTESDLEKLGVLLGDRKRFIKAVKTLVDSSPAFGGTGPADNPAPYHPSSRAAERRHLTVMICDLVDSTALSARLDPEDMRAVMDAYHAACARITLFYEGFVTDFRGDGILAIFGYPRAHEDDADRTVRAGMDIAAAVARLRTPAAVPLSVRIGIASGLVLVRSLDGEDALRGHSLVGDPPNIAARLQALVSPGTVVVAGSTRRLLGDRFRLRELGRHEVKGIAEPVAAFAVEGIGAAESRFEAGHPTGLANLIDREKESGFLLERQGLAWKGEGQIVLISGEAGIGKSRLVAALEERIANEPYTALRYQCSPHYSNSALHPIIAQLERAAGLTTADNTTEQRLDKLEALLAKSGARGHDAVDPVR
jgi:class 3 adenylate cyclase